MIINRIKRNIFSKFSLCGKSFDEVQNRFISDINDVTCLNEAKPDKGLLCLIYDDTPLIDNETLSVLEALCLSTGKGFSIGNGFIAPIGYLGTLENPNIFSAQQFESSLYPDFLSIILHRILNYHLKNGVIIFDTKSTFIDFDVHLCSGCKIRPFTTLEGVCYVGKNSTIYEHSFLSNSHVGDNVIIKSSYVFDSRIGDNSTVGPFAYIRNGASVGNSCRIGDFVEIKASRLGSGVKCAHLTYVGDATIGEKTNVGCGTVFCNYDGEKKHRTNVGTNTFIGANTNLIAPLSIGNNVFIAAGSTVTDNVPENSFVIARSKQTTKNQHISE